MKVTYITQFPDKTWQYNKDKEYVINKNTVKTTQVIYTLNVNNAIAKDTTDSKHGLVSSKMSIATF